ncbi:hypothetical protein GGI05_001936, partial [Coemansia sp. RSA 2603]
MRSTLQNGTPMLVGKTDNPTSSCAWQRDMLTTCSTTDSAHLRTPTVGVLPGESLEASNQQAERLHSNVAAVQLLSMRHSVIGNTNEDPSGEGRHKAATYSHYDNGDCEDDSEDELDTTRVEYGTKHHTLTPASSTQLI